MNIFGLKLLEVSLVNSDYRDEREKQMEGKKSRRRERNACVHSCRKKNFGTGLGKSMRGEDVNFRMLKYRHEIKFLSQGLLQFYLLMCRISGFSAFFLLNFHGL